jgi:hypothetical protein
MKVGEVIGLGKEALSVDMVLSSKERENLYI